MEIWNFHSKKDGAISFYQDKLILPRLFLFKNGQCRRDIFWKMKECFIMAVVIRKATEKSQ